jgi:hypothetical protein
MEKIVTKLPKEFQAHDKILRDAVFLAIEKAERYGTPLVVKKNGRIVEISPVQFRREIARDRKHER